MSVTGRQTVAHLVPLVIRAMSWRPLVAAATGAFSLVAVLRIRHVEPAGLLAGVRAAAVLLGAGAAFALDDTAASTLAAVPTTRLVRRAVRLTLVLVPFAVLWAGLLALAAPLPVGAITLEAMGMLAVTLAVAAAAGRWSADGLGGIAGGPALTLLLLASFLAQQRWPRLFPLLPGGPGDPSWAAAHLRWSLLLALSVVILVTTAADPAHRRVRLGADA